MDTVTVDVAAVLTALSLLITAVGALWANLKGKIDHNTQVTQETKKLANGNLTEAYRRVDQLKNELMRNGVEIPPFVPPKDEDQEGGNQ